jgi:hypothetical protein
MAIEVWKTEKFLNSPKTKGCNSCKNESITPKRKLNRTLDCKAIHQVSILYLQRWQKKKVLKTEKNMKFYNLGGMDTRHVVKLASMQLPTRSSHAQENVDEVTVHKRI